MATLIKKETTSPLPLRRHIVVNGAVYKKAQLQEMLQQYETASGGIIKVLTQAHQAALGKHFDQAGMILKKLDGVIDDNVLSQLKDLTDTMAGHVGMGGN